MGSLNCGLLANLILSINADYLSYSVSRHYSVYSVCCCYGVSFIPTADRVPILVIHLLFSVGNCWYCTCDNCSDCRRGWHSACIPHFCCLCLSSVALAICRETNILTRYCLILWALLFSDYILYSDPLEKWVPLLHSTDEATVKWRRWWRALSDAWWLFCLLSLTGSWSLTVLVMTWLMMCLPDPPGEVASSNGVLSQCEMPARDILLWPVAVNDLSK